MKAIQISLKNPNPGVWFDVPSPDGVKNRICVRGWTIDQINLATELTTERKVDYKTNPKTKALERFVVTEDKPGAHMTRLEMMWDFCISEWELEDTASGEEIPCTREMKIKLMKEVPAFSVFVNEKIAEVSEILKQKDEEEEKNL